MDIKDNISRISSVSTEPHTPCKILIIHSEGNVNNNPNLSGLVEILCENGYSVDIASPRRDNIVQKSPHPQARFLLTANPKNQYGNEFVLLEGKPLSTRQQVVQAVDENVENYDIVIGVDRSIVEAAIIGQVREIPYGLISYEIFFEKETSRQYKTPEIMACQNVSFVICQDPVRAAHLSRENQIPPEKILYIPVAGRGAIAGNKEHALHDKLGIERNKKIAIYIGSVGAFFMTQELIDSALMWPQDWVLVIHNRYGLSEDVLPFYQRYSGGKNIYFSCDAVETPGGMFALLNSAEIGVALYRPTPGSKWTGDNIRYVGFASGKISTYLQHGLPVLINEIGAMSDSVRRFNLGKVHSGPLPIQVPDAVDLKECSQNARRFFAEYLDLNKTSQPFLECLNRLISKKKTNIHSTCETADHRHSQDGACDVSIILGTKDRAKLLEPMLHSLKDAAEGIRYEVIVIEGDSSDNTSEILRNYNIKQIYNEKQHLGPGRHSWPQLYNFGFSKARGKWAMYASDDIVFGRESIRRAVELLNQQTADVAGGIFFYKNARAEAGWDKFGIDFTNGPKLLLNYGLIRLDDFKRVGGLDEAYKFYCADTDLCYKLYQLGKQLIPLPGCFVVHNNVLDVQKKINTDNSGKDIELYKQRWGHFVSMETPKPRRLLWQDNYLAAFLLPPQLRQLNTGIEYFWQGLACLQQGMPQEAQLNFSRAVQAQCSHWIVQWHLAKAATECGDRAIAQSAAETVLRQSPDFKPAKDLLTQIAPESQQQSRPQTSQQLAVHVDEGDLLSQIRKLGLWTEGRPLRLHLGSGQQRLKGYVNVDFPPSEHTVQQTQTADIFADITQLEFKSQSVDEIRLHHVFELFDRPAALALLCKWHLWLKPGGRLVIETPDFDASIDLIRSGQCSYQEKQAILRHLFGSHEADWAVHKDGWYGEKFQSVLGRFGFDDIRIELSKWGVTRNVTACAVKSKVVPLSALTEAAKQILSDSMVDQSEIEKKQWGVWCRKLDKALNQGCHQPAQELKDSIGIIFSKDRAMQLDACIRSFFLTCKDSDTVDLRVLYKCSNDYHRQLYNQLFDEYPSVQFVEEKDFKKDLLSSLDGFQYILFLVDDNLFVSPFSMSSVIKSLSKNPGALGFSLRLGKNISYYYQADSDQPLPQFTPVDSDVLRFDWTTATKNFGYPLEVSSSVYRCGDIRNVLERLNYQNPNTLEAQLAEIRNLFSSDKNELLCFCRSVAFCNPANIIQTTFPDNKKSGREDYSVDRFAGMFKAGYRIDVERLLDFVPLSCHQEIEFCFINPKSAHNAVGSKPPLVSIYMSMYNTAQYLAETLDSILNQTFTDWELVIVDDGSADHSLQVAREYQNRDSRIRVSAIPHVGVVKARNEALRQCHPQAAYLMNHDSDDISLPDKLRQLVDYLDHNPEIAIVGCFAEYFGDGSIGKKPPYLEWQPQRIRQTFGEVNSMIHSAAMMRHEVVRKIGCYRDIYPPAEDYDFFAMALMAGFECANIPKVLHRIRLHRRSLSAVQSNVQQVHAEKIGAGYRHYLRTNNRVEILQESANSKYAARACASGNTMTLSPAGTGTKTEIFRSSGKPCLSILHTVEFYAPHIGGSEEVIQQLSQRLVKRGHRVTVATTKLPERNFRELNGVKIEEYDITGNMVRGVQGRDGNRYAQLVCSDVFDVMLNYGAQQWATDMAFISLESTASKRVNLIAPCGFSALSDAKTLRVPQYEKYYNKIIPACVPRYDAAVYHSAMYKDYEYAKDHGFANSIVIPNGTSEEEFSTRSRVDFRRKYGITTKYFGLCVANFYPGKGHSTVIETVRQMNRPDFTLVFIGKEGQLLPELQKLAAGLNIGFCVNIPRQDTVAAYQSADLFLFGSQMEVSPLVIIEAKASRTPFISTDVGNVREWKGGIVCTPEKMAYYTNALLDNEPARKALAQEGWSEWKEKLTWESVVDRYELLYMRLQKTKQMRAR